MMTIIAVTAKGEEMSKEKQIDEMAKYCHFYEDGNCTLCEELWVACDSKCDMCDFAKRLYNAGYRKASDVVKLEEKLADVTANWQKIRDAYDADCVEHYKKGRSEVAREIIEVIEIVREETSPTEYHRGYNDALGDFKRVIEKKYMEDRESE